MMNPIGIRFMLALLIACSIGCKQGGQEVRVKKTTTGSGAATAHEPGRYDLKFKTESLCKDNHGTWDSVEGECYVICMSTDKFDEVAQKCVGGTSVPAETKPEAGDRYDLEFKNESECKKNQGLWDSKESECYVICSLPNVFDQVNKKCVLKTKM